ncbi:hypothetical protein SETIT_7G300400v2 [Setaria italica]|uniref:Zinc finger C3HC4 RING-type domain-containing protein n=1 Tax=Setaria italica TaxID=4555 RepID=A0A368S1B9_SETIT|nr:hypothetical protein SETIT_7G300400v2 [Setaria italica]
MVSPALIVVVECVLVSLVTIIAPIVLACCYGNTRNNEDQQQADGELPRWRRRCRSRWHPSPSPCWNAWRTLAARTPAASADPSASNDIDCSVSRGGLRDLPGPFRGRRPVQHHATLCRHEFRKACIAGWIMAYNTTCPLCRPSTAVDGCC